jgi:Fe(3+) dicitrate transport protein
VAAGDELPYVPRHQLFASVDVARQAWRTRVDATYSGRMRTAAGQGPFADRESTDAYLAFGLSGELALNSSTSLFASVQNLANRASIVARHPAGVRPGIPRLFMAGLKFDLGR